MEDRTGGYRTGGWRTGQDRTGQGNGNISSTHPCQAGSGCMSPPGRDTAQLKGFNLSCKWWFLKHMMPLEERHQKAST